jgi:hypothetical protein
VRRASRPLAPLIALALLSCRASEPEPGPPRDERAERAALEDLGYLAGYTEPQGGERGVVRHDRARRAPGLDLVLSSHRPGAVLMDARGAVLHEWTLSWEAVAPGRSNPKDWWRRAEVLPDGGILAIYDYRAIVRLDRDSRLVWADLGPYHHDAFLDADGRTWALFLQRTEDGERGAIRVLDERGEPEREISIKAALERSPHAGLLGPLREREDSGLHVNELTRLDGRHAARLPALRRGNLLISPRNLDAVAALDPRSESIEWLLTGPWRHQHTPSLLPGGGLLLFDNLGAEGRRSRVLEVDPVSGETLWSWDGGEEGFFSGVMGAAQGLANGNVLVVASTQGRVVEVTRDGTVVWEYRNPHRVEVGGETKVATLPHVERLPAEAVLDWLPVSR